KCNICAQTCRRSLIATLHTHKQTNTLTQRHTHINTHTHTHAHTHAHAAYIHTYTYTHTLLVFLPESSSSSSGIVVPAQLFMCARTPTLILTDTKSLSRFSFMKFSSPRWGAL